MPDPDGAQFEPITIETHHDFRRHMREIVSRMNSSPQVARLTLVNPIYALTDLGVILSKEMEQHVYDTFHNPPAKKRRLATLEAEIQDDLNNLLDKPELPKTPAARSKLLFHSLGLASISGEHQEAVSRTQLASYAHAHPLVGKLVEYEIVQRSGLVFHPHATYDAYRRGEVRQKWVNDVRFGGDAPTPSNS